MLASNLVVLAMADAKLRDVIERYLRNCGCQTHICGSTPSIDAIREALTASEADVLVLDPAPSQAGELALLKRVRQVSNVKIVLLVDQADFPRRIALLEAGADECLVKPIYPREFLARVQNLIRRDRTAAIPKSIPEKTVIAFSGWWIDVTKRALFGPSRAEVPLSTAEYDLLMTFVQNANRVISRGELLRTVRHREWRPDDRSIDVQVGHLRKKLETKSMSETFIKTVHGTGYIFTSAVSHRTHTP